MGSCISKCRPKTPPPPKEFNLVHVQDKLVISHPTTKDPPILPSIKSPTSLSSSPSSSCTTSLSTTSCSFSKSPLSSTCSSSTSCSNYTNEFLWSYGKENPHYSLKTSPVKLVSNHIPASSKLVTVPLKSSRQHNQSHHVGSTTPSKRSRANSPTLVRQKSFRREQERSHQVSSSLPRRNMGVSSPSRRFHSDASEPDRVYLVPNSVHIPSSSPSRRFHSPTPESDRVKNSIPRRNFVSSSPSRRFNSGMSEPDRSQLAASSVPPRNLISSSPSRRFHDDVSELDKPQLVSNSLPRKNLISSSPSRVINNDMCRGVPKKRPIESCKSEIAPKRDTASLCSSARNKENICPSLRGGSSMNKTETCTHQIERRANQTADGLMVSNKDLESLPIDDIDNPLISLDCFIFL